MEVVRQELGCALKSGGEGLELGWGVLVLLKYILRVKFLVGGLKGGESRSPSGMFGWIARGGLACGYEGGHLGTQT